MQIQITDTITEDDQNALLAGLRAYNRQFLRTTNFGDWRCTGAMSAMTFWVG